MDFYIYDNIMTFNKLKPNNSLTPSIYEVSRIELPKNNSFWFFTDMNLHVDNVNLQKKYVHIHPGIGSTNEFTFENNTVVVTKSNLKYDPKNKRVEVKDSVLPWSKPIFMKKCLFHGASLPNKKISVAGGWLYDFPTNSMHFIIDYFSQKIQYYWEDEKGEDMATPEQVLRVKELEKEIGRLTVLQKTDLWSDL
tara:strand:+ start:1835 stop:2416 length:582 start_codon:yes stop_codon:yes gene_type:complete